MPAFDALPDHARALPERHAIFAEHITPIERQWQMPMAVWSARRGFDATNMPDSYAHHTITRQLTPAHVRRVSAAGAVKEEDHGAPDAIWFQPSFGDTRFIADESLRFAHLYVAQPFLRMLADDSCRGGSNSIDIPYDRNLFSDRELTSLYTAYVARACDQTSLPCTLEMDARGTLIGLQLLKQLCSAEPIAKTAKGGLAPLQLRRISAYLHEHLAEDTPLSELADLVGLSPYHFCRAFKQATGLPPHRWRLARRIDRARQLLDNTDLPVSGVAAAVGYDDPSHLAGTFRKMVGITPTQYRRERRS